MCMIRTDIEFPQIICRQSLRPLSIRAVVSLIDWRRQMMRTTGREMALYHVMEKRWSTFPLVCPHAIVVLLLDFVFCHKQCPIYQKTVTCICAGNIANPRYLHKVEVICTWFVFHLCHETNHLFYRWKVKIGIIS